MLAGKRVLPLLTMAERVVGWQDPRGGRGCSIGAWEGLDEGLGGSTEPTSGSTSAQPHHKISAPQAG